MRILVRYCLPFGNYSTAAVEIDLNKQIVVQLRKQIQQKFKIPISRQIIKLKRDEFHIRITDSFPLIFYELTENTVLIVEQIQNKTKHNMRYFEKLQIIQSVAEEQEFALSNGSQTSFQNSFDDDQESFDEQNLKEKLLKEVNNQNIHQVQCIMQDCLANKHEHIFDEYGPIGWNALHFASFQGNNAIVTELLNQSCDVNKPTQEGWTPLQLAIRKNNVEVFNTLMSNPHILINDISQKGCALQIALKENRNDLAEQLIISGADLDYIAEDGSILIDFTSNENLLNIIKARQGQKNAMRPPLIVGNIKKTKFLMFQVSVQYLVCDPWEGTIKIYKDQSYYPMQHKHIIHLTQIRSLQKLKKQWFAPQLFFVEIIHAHRIMLAFDFELSAQKWIDKIYQASVFQKLKQDIFKNMENYSEQITQLQEMNNLNGYEQFEIQDVQDFQCETLDKYCKLFYKRITTNCQNCSFASITKKNQTPVVQEIVQKPKESLKLNSFEVLEMLGSGSFGTVYKVILKQTKEVFAMKQLKKKKLIQRKQLRFAITEANILKESNHPFVLKMYYAFQTPQNLYLVTDYCAGRDLSLVIASKMMLEEDEAKFYLAELILAINYLHKEKILYRDLKPENILIDTDGHIKLADFGLSKENVGDNDMTQTFCGSPAYLAPEMLRKKGVTKSADIYGIGCVLFEMLTGEPPFMDDQMDALTKKIESGKINLPQYISEDAKRGLLDKNVKQRTTFFQNIYKDPFFKGIDFEALENKQIQPPALNIFQTDENEESGRLINIQDVDYNEENKNVNRVQDFSFSR